MEVDEMFKQSTKIMFVLLLFTYLVFSQTTCNVATQFNFNQPSSPTDIGNNWKTLCVLGLLISSLIVAALLMLGRLMENEYLINRAKTDLNQILVTAVILIVFSAFVTVMCSIDGTQFGLQTPSLFDSAGLYFNYAQSLAFNSYINTISAIMTVSGLASLYTSSSNAIPLGVYVSLSLMVRPFSGFSAAAGVLQYLSSLTMLSVSITSGYMVILNVVQTWFLNLLLPAGIVMRCFTPTREFGGALIALAIGLFLFYPLLFSFSYILIGQPTAPGTPDSSGWYNVIITEAGVFTTASAIPYGLVGAVAGNLAFASGLAGGTISTAFASVGQSLIPVFILPAINWIILVAIVRGLSKAMGEEVDISSLTRLI